MMTCARGGGALGPVRVLATALVSAIVSTVWAGGQMGCVGKCTCGEGGVTCLDSRP